MTKYILLILSSVFLLSALCSTDVLPLEDTQNTRFLQASSGNISLPSSSFEIPNFFTIYYEFQPAGYITMALKFLKPNQYFSIGFGSKMDKADMWVFNLVGSEITVADHIGSGHKTPPNDLNKGGTNDLERLGYEITPGYSLVKIRRALSTGDPNDFVITQNPFGLIYATAQTRVMTEHYTWEYGYGITTLVEGGNGIFTPIKIVTGAQKTHSILNLIAWAVIVDLFIIFVRLTRGRKWTIGSFVISAQMIHALFMGIAAVVSIFVTIIVLAKNRKGKGFQLSQQSDYDFHFINGLVFLILTVATVLVGFAEFIFLRGPNKSARSALLLKNLHTVIGVLVYLVAKASVITGALIYDNGSWKTGTFIYLGILLLIHILIQIRYFFWDKNSNVLQPKANKPSDKLVHKLILQDLNGGAPREKILAEFPQIKWVILGNSVYDLTGWIHPGGNSLIEACVGREVGRYFYGNLALEGSNVKPHKHSAIALSQMSSFYVGELNHCENVVMHKEIKQESLAPKADVWKITAVSPISDTVSEIRFRNDNYLVKNFGTSLSWLSRSFRVSFDSDSSAARMYTTAFALTKANFDLRQNIYKYFDEIMAGNTTATFTYDSNYLNLQAELPIFIKNYTNLKNSFSSALHKTDLNTQMNAFRIEGPLSRGMELLPTSSGTHVIICAGTGALPFVDFLALFLWKTMYELIKEKAGEDKAQAINVLNMPFKTLLNGMKLKFIGAFANEKEVLGLDIIRKLAEINKKYKVGCFSAMIKGYSDENIIPVSARFSLDFLSKVISKDEEKYYVVGPLSFNEEITKILSNLGVPKGKITLV